MTDKLYNYSGPRTSVTLSNGRRFLLVPGTEIALPDGTYTASLVSRGFAELVPATPTPDASKAEPDASPKAEPEVPKASAPTLPPKGGKHTTPANELADKSTTKGS